MTAQIADTLVLDDSRFSIVGVKGEGLFNPETYGPKPVARCTACWRGYICHYRIEDDCLVLDSLEVWLDGSVNDENSVCPQVAPEIDGVSPVACTIDTPRWGVLQTGEFVYKSLGKRMEFTGGLLLGDGFIRDLYVHMGFHPAWKYETVIELILDRGRPTEKRDLIEKMRETRNNKLKEPLRPPRGASNQELMSWIESTFRLDNDS